MGFRSRVAETQGVLRVRAAWTAPCGHRSIAWWPVESKRGAAALAETLRRLARRDDVVALSDLSALIGSPALLSVTRGCAECEASLARYVEA